MTEDELKTEELAMMLYCEVEPRTTAPDDLDKYMYYEARDGKVYKVEIALMKKAFKGIPVSCGISHKEELSRVANIIRLRMAIEFGIPKDLLYGDYASTRNSIAKETKNRISRAFDRLKTS